MRGAWVLALALTAGACDAPAPPAVSVRQRSLDADDLAVMRALFDDLLRLEAFPGQAGAPRLLVVDTTTAMCRRDPTAFGPQPSRCLYPESAEIVTEVVPAGIRPTVRLRFPTWNATRLSISGPLGEGVTYVSATLFDMIVQGDVLQRYLPGGVIVTLSAPGYPAPGMAVMTFTAATQVGAARLERQTGGRWRVAGSVIRSVD